MSPALTPEEWERWTTRGRNYAAARNSTGPEGFSLISESGRHTSCSPEDRHTVAALCLYGQQFGFSQQEYRALAALVNMEGPRPMVFVDDADAEPLLQSVLAKIAALLPPETP